MSKPSTQHFLELASAAITPQRFLLDSIRDINMHLLELLRDAAPKTEYACQPELGAVGPLLTGLTDEVIDQAARFPFLLMDLGLADPLPAGALRSLRQKAQTVRDQGMTPECEGHVALARSALLVGWHATRSDAGSMLLLFGLAPGVAEELAVFPLQDVESLAPVCVRPLTLRWRHDRRLWKQVLNPNAYKSVDTLRGFVTQAVQLTATHHLRSI